MNDHSLARGTEAPIPTFTIGKPFRLLPWRALKSIGEMMEYFLSIGKHGKDDWRRMPEQEHVDHADGHMALYDAGDDSEDHLAHAACRLLMALEQREHERARNHNRNHPR
jgi:hypothetical protein